MIVKITKRELARDTPTRVAGRFDKDLTGVKTNFVKNILKKLGRGTLIQSCVPTLIRIHLVACLERSRKVDSEEVKFFTTNYFG